MRLTRNTLARTACVAAMLLLLAGPMSGCGGESGPSGELRDAYIMGLYSKDWEGRFYELAPESEESWVRSAMITVGWKDVEPRQDAFTWDRLDGTIGLLRDKGVEYICLTLDKYLPDWAGPRYGPPSSLEDWGDFCGAVAERYADDVEFYQIWNEPSHDPAWQKAKGSTFLYFGGDFKRDYPGMLEAAYGAIKPADESSVVIAGAMNFAITTRPEDGLTLYEEMFSPPYELQRFCDAIAVHPYYMPEDWGRFYVLLRDLMDRLGVEQELVMTEIGWPHNFIDGEEVQRRALADQGVGAIVEAGGRKFWVYTDIDDHPEQRYDFDYGLIDYQGNPLPSWEAYKDWIRRFDEFNSGAAKP